MIDAPQRSSAVPTNGKRADRYESSAAEQAAETTMRRRVRTVMVTPWNQVCGNAEYAAKLIEGMSELVEVIPLELKWFPFPPNHFRQLQERIQAADPDVVHIQHEYVFFGKDTRSSDRQLHQFISGLSQPVVVTLHTIHEARLRSLFSRGLCLVLNKLGAVLPRRITDYAVRRVRALMGGSSALHRALKKARTVVVHTEISAAMLLEVFPDLQEKLQVVPIPISDIPATKPSTIVKQEGEVWLTMLGFVNSYKQHHLAVKALSLLPENYRLMIIGGPHPNDTGAGNYWRQVLKTIDRLRLMNRVTITGFIADRATYFGIVESADVFLMPYKEVGQSASAVLGDVLSFGKPIVTSTARSMYEYRYGADTCGCTMMADVRDPRQFADQILHAYQERLNPNAVYLEHGRNVRRKYGMSAVSETYHRIYREAGTNP